MTVYLGCYAVVAGCSSHSRRIPSPLEVTTQSPAATVVTPPDERDTGTAADAELPPAIAKGRQSESSMVVAITVAAHP